ncbi:MAG: SAF domain-containing protein [Propionibacteriaceae bacterium]|nr:SAF domain-containing protein [Propionibacteriaceae bacterium]
MRRSLQLVLIGLICAGVGLGGVYLAWRAVHDGQDVWVAARPLAAGQVIGQDDVRQASVNVGNNVAYCPADQLVVGKVMLVDVPEGTMLTPASVGTAPPASGLARVGVVVDIGRAPVTSLQFGDAVILVGPDGDAVPATVASAPELLPDAARHRFDVDVTWQDAPRLARWVGLGQVVVVKP